MNIKDMFDVGVIMEPEERKAVMDADNCTITGKQLNKNKIILHMKSSAGSEEGNVFVKLKEQYDDQFNVSKKLFASKKVIGLTLSKFKNFDIESL